MGILGIFRYLVGLGLLFGFVYTVWLNRQPIDQARSHPGFDPWGGSIISS